ncbi:MAG: SOS response-associated peptidase [Saprospiraceae bacterium]|nr:SOS response-associated peptidase [Saprospiraceae bacterium]
MCGRSSLTKTEKELEERFNATFYSEDLERYNPLPNYNVAPTHYMPVITNKDPIHFNVYRWGLIPFWAKDEKIGSSMINARIETIQEKATYKNTFQHKRCLVPMDGFYEWKKDGKQKVPFRIITKDQEVFSVAGMWEHWRNPSGLDIYTYTVITLPANEKMSELHDRMPAILHKEHESLWINEDMTREDALSLLQPYPSDLIDFYEVSNKVNSVRENEVSLIKPVQSTIQTKLF